MNFSFCIVPHIGPRINTQQEFSLSLIRQPGYPAALREGRALPDPACNPAGCATSARVQFLNDASKGSPVQALPRRPPQSCGTSTRSAPRTTSAGADARAPDDTRSGRLWRVSAPSSQHLASEFGGGHSCVTLAPHLHTSTERYEEPWSNGRPGRPRSETRLTDTPDWRAVAGRRSETARRTSAGRPEWPPCYPVHTHHRSRWWYGHQRSGSGPYGDPGWPR